jgi:copper chaperone CopZ
MKQALAGLIIVVPLAFASPTSATDATARATLSIRGMTCGGCVAAVKVQLKRTVGVTAYEVSLEKAEAEVTYDPARTDPRKIAESVSETGFAASVKEAGETGKGSSTMRPPEPTARGGRLEPWEPVDVAFTACSEGVCGLRGRNPQAVAQPGAQPGQLVYCPVSGAVFRIKDTSPRADVHGKSLYLCCDACARYFAQNRDRVLAQRELSL